MEQMQLTLKDDKLTWKLKTWEKTETGLKNESALRKMLKSQNKKLPNNLKDCQGQLINGRSKEIVFQLNFRK